MAIGEEMKALLVIVLVALAAATALAYGGADVAAGVTAVFRGRTTEPAALLLSGSALVGLASVIRRCMGT
jgi:hypothetical protein